MIHSVLIIMIIRLQGELLPPLLLIKWSFSFFGRNNATKLDHPSPPEEQQPPVQAE